MGWTVLYIAFGVVALWLLGEVLLQYKARLRWRLLAFTGFLGVVLGVLLPSVAVIIAGAVAFAVGQTYVTLSFRRGFSTGWAIGGNPGASRRRKAGAQARQGPPSRSPRSRTTLSTPTPRLTASATTTPPPPRPPRSTSPTRCRTTPASTGSTAWATRAPVTRTAATTAATRAPVTRTPVRARDTARGTSSRSSPPTTRTPRRTSSSNAAYDYGAPAPQQQYAAYSDPYIGPGTDGQQYTSYYGDPYAPSYSYDTPPGGVWVPQQRDTEQPPQQAPQPQAPYGYEQHPDEQQQYRY